jgi:hypothetical protein
MRGNINLKGGFVFGVVHPKAISFFDGPNLEFEITKKTCLADGGTRNSVGILPQIKFYSNYYN